jgi:hypothetical protein
MQQQHTAHTKATQSTAQLQHDTTASRTGCSWLLPVSVAHLASHNLHVLLPHARLHALLSRSCKRGDCRMPHNMPHHPPQDYS